MIVEPGFTPPGLSYATSSHYLETPKGHAGGLVIGPAVPLDTLYSFSEGAHYPLFTIKDAGLIILPHGGYHPIAPSEVRRLCACTVFMALPHPRPHRGEPNPRRPKGDSEGAQPR